MDSFRVQARRVDKRFPVTSPENDAAEAGLDVEGMVSAALAAARLESVGAAT